MIATYAVKAALSAALDGFADFTVIPYLGELEGELPDRLVWFADSTDDPATTTYEIGDEIGCKAATMLAAESRILLWITSLGEDESTTAVVTEQAAALMLAKLVQFINADRTLGVTLDGVQRLRVSVAGVDSSNVPMSKAGGQRVQAARMAVDLAITATINPGALDVSEA